MPDAIPEGEILHTISLLMHNRLVDVAKPGDRIKVCLILHDILILHSFLLPSVSI